LVFAMYAATGEGTVLTGIAGGLELAVAVAVAVAAGMAAFASLAIASGRLPERTWLLVMLTILLDLIWWTFISTVAEHA
jgi:hypothetical protein